MHWDVDWLMTAYENGPVTRRVFLGSLAALAVTPPTLAQQGPPMPVRAINHMTLSVSDPTRSLEWYQGLFGMVCLACRSRRVRPRRWCSGSGADPSSWRSAVARAATHASPISV